jgi:NifU-like protein involved in Fe-S cluster formation
MKHIASRIKVIHQYFVINKIDIAGYLKLLPVKLHCSMLAEDAIKKAIEDLK